MFLRPYTARALPRQTLAKVHVVQNSRSLSYSKKLEQKTTPSANEPHEDTLKSDKKCKDPTNLNNKTISQVSKETVSDFLEGVRPYLDKAHHHYMTTSKQIDSIVVPFKFHWNKAKEAIKEANAKLETQEKESQSYAFNEDLSSNEKKKIIKGLPSDRERHRKLWAKKLELYIDSLQETIFTATRALNDVTGYSSIQKLRESIEVLEKELAKAKEDAKVTKTEHTTAISKRLETQREVNALLQRQPTWSPPDLERFTKLYKEDHDNSVFEEEAKSNMEKAETKEAELQDKLSNAILTRYHEEQIWSDKIRRTSTWGTFGLMGINILLFLVFQLALEPWKRRRLVGNFEEKVQKALEDNSHQQNARLDLMSQKVEALKQSDRLPILAERVQPEIIEPDYEIIEPPVIRELPYPSPHQTTLQQIINFLNSLFQPFRVPLSLIFYSNYQEVKINKTEIISTTSATLGLGVLFGVLITCIY